MDTQRTGQCLYQPKIRGNPELLMRCKTSDKLSFKPFTNTVLGRRGGGVGAGVRIIGFDRYISPPSLLNQEISQAIYRVLIVV